MLDGKGGLQEDQAFFRVGPVDPASAGVDGNRLVVGVGIVAEEGQFEPVLPAERAMATARVAADVREDRSDVVGEAEGARLFPRVTDDDEGLSVQSRRPGANIRGSFSHRPHAGRLFRSGDARIVGRKPRAGSEIHHRTVTSLSAHDQALARRGSGKEHRARLHDNADHPALGRRSREVCLRASVPCHAGPRQQQDQRQQATHLHKRYSVSSDFGLRIADCGLAIADCGFGIK